MKVTNVDCETICKDPNDSTDSCKSDISDSCDITQYTDISFVHFQLTNTSH